MRGIIPGGDGALTGLVFTFCLLLAGSSVGSDNGFVPQPPDYRKGHYHLYVARLLDSDLVIMDSVTKEEIGRIEFGAGANPAHIARSGDYKYLYVSLRGSNEVAVVDTEKKELKARIKVGKHPHFIKVLPGGKRLIAVGTEDTRADIIDLDSNAIVGRPEISDSSADVAVTADGRFAYIATVRTGEISVVDLEKMERVAVIAIPGEYPNFMSIAMAAGSNLAYVCNVRRDKILIIDTRTNKVVGEFPTARYPSYITLAPGGARAFVTHTFSNYSESVTVVDLHKRAVIKEIKVGQMPMVPVVSPDGKFLFTANYGVRDEDGTISVVDMDTLAEVERIRFWRVPQAIAVVPAR